MGESGTEEYFDLFNEVAEVDNPNQKENLTSVRDSVRILGICRKINKTLNQSQKFVVLVRLFELVAADRKNTTQRMAIIKTVSEVFKITKENYGSIEVFVFNKDTDKEENENILLLNSYQEISHDKKGIKALEHQKDIIILRIPDVNLYFIKYSGSGELYLNGLGLHKNRIYLFAKGSTIKRPQGKPLYYSDISAHFLYPHAGNKILFKAEGINLYFKNGVRGLKDISFTADHGNMIAIMGSSGAGKTTLLNTLSGIEKPASGSVKVNG